MAGIPREAMKAAVAKAKEMKVNEAESAEQNIAMLVGAAAPAIRKRVREVLTPHVCEWALGLLRRGATDEDWIELPRLMQITDPPDTDDPCTCGHVRHEHHTWNENASVGCGYCGCEQFHLDLSALDTLEDPDESEAG